MNRIRLATRRSELALVQAKAVQQQLGCPVHIVEVVTSGDRKQQLSGDVIRDKQDWIAEIEQELIGGGADLAIHSSKDVPIEVHSDTNLLPVLARANPADIFVSRQALTQGVKSKFKELNRCATVGTSSPRRRAQLLRSRPDLNVIDFRGNVTTRLRKLKESEKVDGMILAAAGLERLNMAESVCAEELSFDQMLPAVNQGILAVQYQRDRGDIAERVQRLVDYNTYSAWSAERAVVEGLGADCSSAVGVFCAVRNREVELRCQIYSRSGEQCISDRQEGAADDAASVGRKLAERLLSAGARELLSA